ncbi:Molybdopterin or thiamine biosynthesis adenylyltransferase [Blastococcus sp. DSM 46786]|uniref:ThiF family adenylyltransferase n=1 Tax=Blastococcus sp. DSM 46786 TaxID=1798227 RepID=UPI0008AAA9D5|nr:ThiF family adenylyltransferase [Blastococcus sp. DSM 46786]SEK21532.1 Molybdopterin or thiamine biosynthesis adenylyltransferase [Blastococcus sp. DSM 46786]
MSDNAHPLLPAATPLLAGDAGSVQVGGVDSTDGLLLGAAAGLAPVLRALDGRRSRRTVRAEAAGQGLPPELVDAAVDALRSAGLVHDLDPADLLVIGPGPAAAARAVVELPSAGSSPGPGSWRARRRATVVVEGATRVGTPLAAVLAASGVGRVVVRDTGVVTAADAVVGGLTAADEGRPRAVAAADAVRRASPLTDLGPLPVGLRPDLVVLTRPWAASDPLVPAVPGPHLVAAVRGETGVVGPLVVPGASSCLRCADLHRRDADPRWPRLAAQLTASETPPSGATLTCLLTAVLAAGQVLACIDGRGAPVTLDATVELRPPDLLPHLRRWPPHPSCGCGAATGGDDLSGAGGACPPGGDPPARATMAADRALGLTGHDTAPLRPAAGEEDV